MTIVLFLDCNWQPLRIEPWTRAIVDCFRGRAEVIAYSRDRSISVVGGQLPMPAVVRVVRQFRRPRPQIRFSRVNVYARDAFTCQYCGERKFTEDLTFDHVLPRAQGGKNSWENIVTCCVACNHRKGNRTPEQARMPLLRTPVRPTFLPIVSVARRDEGVPAEWRPYWNGVLGEDN